MNRRNFLTSLPAFSPAGVALAAQAGSSTVSYQGRASSYTVPVAEAAPSLFTANESGVGQAAAINNVDGSYNTAANPVRAGGYIQLYATGEGQLCRRRWAGCPRRWFTRERRRDRWLG
jgi:uncharacterized protein (TIGR03437 family)